jgi:hypothetical protein
MAVTEQDWWTCTEPPKMLEFLRGKVSDRKLRLFAVACCRHHLPLARDDRVGEAVDVAERFADGLAGDEERSNARKAAQRAAQVRGVVARPDAPKWERRAASLAYYAAARQAMEAAWNVPQLAVEVLVWRSGGYNACNPGAIKAEQGVVHSGLLRDIFGPLPFRPVAVEDGWLAWNAGTVKRLAEAAYQDRVLPDGTLDNARLAVLADALEESGCGDADLLGHLRGPGPHYRGCWAVDLLSGRE